MVTSWLQAGVHLWTVVFLMACTFLIVTLVRSLPWKVTCLILEGLALWFLPVLVANLFLVGMVATIVANDRTRSGL